MYLLGSSWLLNVSK